MQNASVLTFGIERLQTDGEKLGALIGIVYTLEASSALVEDA